jgi:hypothetical protein
MENESELWGAGRAVANQIDDLLALEVIKGELAMAIGAGNRRSER